MVSAVRRGASVRAVAKRFGVAHSTVVYWVSLAAGKRLDRVDFASRRRGPRRPANKVTPEVEQLVLTLRTTLKESSALGEYGAAAIHEAMVRRRVSNPPSIRTIGRILERRGVLDGRRRVRRPPPPRGWYLPEVAAQKAELDSFDIVEGLVIRGGYSVEVLNVVSLWGGLVESWPRARITAKSVVSAILGHWRRFGMPSYAQFDNDTVFQGAHHHRDSLGRVIRVCLALDVTAVFAPPRETGFQAMVENFNGRWQDKVWSRFTFESRKQLQTQSAKFITASRRRAAARIDAAPDRYGIPDDWEIDLQAPLRGQVIFLRRTDNTGHARLLGRTFSVDRYWPNRLVRAEVDLDNDLIRFHALRRRQPDHQPLLNTAHYHFPRKRFNE
jgi:transposase-like protein